jgi:hypothetical protein
MHHRTFYLPRTHLATQMHLSPMHLPTHHMDSLTDPPAGMVRMLEGRVDRDRPLVTRVYLPSSNAQQPRIIVTHSLTQTS